MPSWAWFIVGIVSTVVVGVCWLAWWLRDFWPG